MRIIANCFTRAALLLVAAAACSRVEEQLLTPPANAPRATARCLDRNAGDYYFMTGQIDSSRDDSFMRRDWFARYLRVAEADSLSCGTPSETYRLLWMPSSRGARIVTVSYRSRNWTIATADFGQSLFGFSTPDPPPLARSERGLSRSEVELIRGDLKALDFWTEPQFRDGGVHDGWALTLEGRSGDRYHAVTRVNVRDGYDLVACTLFDLGGLPSFGDATSFECSKPPRKVPLP
jgi:hypothetical protein